MKKILTTLMGLVAFNVLADVIIYDNHLIYTMTGSGRATHLSNSGWTVLDIATGAITQLDVLKSQKAFEVLSLTTDTHYVAGLSGKNLVVMYIQPLSGVSGLGTATGAVTSLNVGTQSHTAARTLTMDGSYVDGNWPDSYWQTVKGSLTFDSKRTVAQNHIDGDYTNVVQRLTQVLLNEGYTQVP